MKMLKLFRAIALIEGITTIALFLIAMPLKYGAEMPFLIRPMGMAHGFAWIGYVTAMAICLPDRGLSIWEWVKTFLYALIPFGTIINDPMIKRKQDAASTASSAPAA